MALFKKNFYSVLNNAFTEATIFSISRVSSSEYFLFLVNDLYIGDPLDANKAQHIPVRLCS